jgi:hypothetical protein
MTELYSLIDFAITEFGYFYGIPLIKSKPKTVKEYKDAIVLYMRLLSACQFERRCIPILELVTRLATRMLYRPNMGIVLALTKHLRNMNSAIAHSYTDYDYVKVELHKRTYRLITYSKSKFDDGYDIETDSDDE